MGAPSDDELRDTVDEVAIRALIAAYADVVNRRTWAELAELFLPDAPIELDLRDRPPMRFVGSDAIGEFVGGALEQYPFFEFVALNVRVELRLDGDVDRAGVRTYMCELRQDHAGAPSRAFGVYQDVVGRDPDRPRHWRFARRSYRSLGRGEYALDLMPPPTTPSG
ncbi:MAG: nuclear transport factor 2 family protein [Acidimicrobiia bacterium]